MEEEVETGSETAPVLEVPPEPRRRARPRSNANLYSIVGLGLALLAAGIFFFFFLRPARQRALEEVARFSALDGEVKVKPSATQKWTVAKNAMSLRAADVVQTAPQAGAELTFKTGNIVRLRPDSVVLIGDTDESSETTLRVQSGQVNFDLQKKIQITTPTATTNTAANSEANISVMENGETGIKIFKGSADVSTAKGDKITLKENEAVRVDAKGKAGKKLVLPTPPTSMAPPLASEIIYKAAPNTTTTLEWQPVPGGATYRVAMDYNVVQANLLMSAALDQRGIAGNFHELKGLDPGKYYWRVAGVTADGDEGKYSKVSNFAVVQPPAEPVPTPVAGEALTLAPPEVMGNVVALRGRVAPGSAVSVDGTTIKVQSDGSFSEFIQKGIRREITIKVTGPGGEVTEEKRPVS